MHRAISRPTRALATATAAAAAALLLPASAVATHGITAAVSLDPAGLVGNDQSSYADMTPDGRFVSFASLASNLVPGDTNGVGDVFVRDRRSGVTERVTVGLKGAEADGDSNILGIATSTAISDDGRYVAFKSEATNLVRGDRNGATDVFVRDRVAGTTERISLDSAGDEAPGGGDEPAISPDGRYVAFTTSDFDENFSPDVYLRDRVAQTTVRISVAHDGGETFNSSGSPSVAVAPGGGAVVAFQSAADNIVAGDGDGSGDVFVRDLSGAVPVTERISVSSEEQPGAYEGGFGFGARGPSISNDGRYVAFASDALNFTGTPQTRRFMDVFVRDRQAGTTTHASASTTGGETDGASEGAHISATGGFVAFASFASNLVAESGGDPLLQDAYVRDLAAPSTRRISVATDDANALFGPFDTHVGSGPVSADGLVGAMSTNADNLQAGDDNNNQDVFTHDGRPATDLSLSMTDTPDPVAPRATLTYTLVATNQGSNPAPGAAVRDTLPAGVTFVGASAGCTHSGGTVDCELGTLAAGASATVTISVEPKPTGVITNTATVGSVVTDLDSSDNTATETTTVAK
jgi:uncharacterized repeat protein (TIGR01451 family)